MRTTYILDTSVLLDDPYAYKHFKNSDICLPITTINELDRKKLSPGEAGKNARVCIRQLDQISSLGDISTGIMLEDDIMISVDTTYRDLLENIYRGIGDPSHGDTQILACVIDLNRKLVDNDVVLVSNDFNLRIKTKARGIEAIGYDGHKSSTNELYSGSRIITNESAGLDLQKQGYIDPNEYGFELNANECILFQSDNGDGIALGRKVADNKIKLIKKSFPWGICARNKEQSFAIDMILDKNIDLVTLLGRAGTGKAQPLDADILTPNGWIKMGDIKIGDIVSVPDGSHSKVVGVFPQGEKNIFKVKFSDGTSTECCEEHLWLTQTSKERKYKKIGNVRSTKEIKNTLKSCKDNRKNHNIPITKPIQMTKNNLVIDPYAFGCLLGDGSFRHALKFSSSDNFIVNELRKSLNKVGLKITSTKLYDYRISGKSKIKISQEIISKNDTTNKIYDNINDVKKDNYIINSIYKAIENKNKIYGLYWSFGRRKTNSVLLNYLKDNNLWMKKSEDKFIPDDYKYSSINDRIELLRGLMDTDGSVDKNGKYFEFTTISSRLANDFKWLVQSLGGTVNIVERKTNYTYKNQLKQGQLSYRINLTLPNYINPFKLPRKSERVRNREKYFPRRYITDVIYVGKKASQCILIDHPDHLYITNDCIVTHNTLVTVASALELLINRQEYNKLVIYRPIQSVSADLGFTPGDVNEKLLPWFQAVYDTFEFLFSTKNKNSDSWKRELELYQKRGKIEFGAITYIRGRSIPNAIIIADEMQNMSKEDIKTILTRAGENTKIILSGDIDQIDTKDLDAMNNGLTYVIEKFKNSSLHGHITLTSGERSKLATLSSQIL